MNWQYGVHPAVMRGGDPSRAMDQARAAGYDSLRLLAAPDQEADCRRLFARLAGQSPEGLWFETPLTEDCPLLPIPMRPAYRHGDMTPWGGTQLRDLYHRDIPDDRTGEALEISAIPQLESVTSMGETLPQLLSREGCRLTGDCAGQPFPLLLKLLAAKQPLSVQVHPDDAYASLHEHKLGKTEAWVILHADEGASILYGLRDGVTLDGLRSALEGGRDVEPLIRRVSVHAGDVYYMPSGMVHAIGGGILLYEIQQSSDVTYRLWDYNRTNAQGEKRPLHIRQSLDVINPSLKGAQAHMPGAGGNQLTLLLDVPAFRLLCASVNGSLPLTPTPHTFRMLTALDSLTLSWPGEALALQPGDSLLLPASCPAVTLEGFGQALISQC